MVASIEHSQVPPIRTQYLDRSGPMRAHHSGGKCSVFHKPEGATEGDKVEESFPSAISGKQPQPGKCVVILMWFQCCKLFDFIEL